MKNRIFARFARASFIFWHFGDVLVLSTSWNDLFCCCVDDVSIWWQMFNFVLCPKRWFQFNSRIVRTHFSSKMTLNNWKMTAETRSYIFRWRSRFHRRRVSLSSLLTHLRPKGHKNIFCHFFWRQEKVCKLSHIRRQQRVKNKKWQNITSVITSRMCVLDFGIVLLVTRTSTNKSPHVCLVFWNIFAFPAQEFDTLKHFCALCTCALLWLLGVASSLIASLWHHVRP